MNAFVEGLLVFVFVSGGGGFIVIDDAKKLVLT
jgi:hypothetical protein